MNIVERIVKVAVEKIVEDINIISEDMELVTDLNPIEQAGTNLRNKPLMEKVLRRQFVLSVFHKALK